MTVMVATGKPWTGRTLYAIVIERLADVGGVDIVLTHDAPAGVRFTARRIPAAMS
jgi:hypothetical protein